MMVELIQLVDESLARHGFGVLLQTAQDHRPQTPLESSLGSGFLAETAETKDSSDPNWASTLSGGQDQLSTRHS
jgi:hypothetical protein